MTTPEVTDSKTVSDRDFFARLIQLAGVDELDTMLRDALALVIAATGSHRAYIELQRPGDEESRVTVSQGFTASQLERLGNAVSQGRFTEAIVSGETIVSTSALLDAESSGSDPAGAEFILCLPVGADSPIGLIYLQRRSESGQFDESARRNAELFSIQVAALAERLAIKQRHDPKFAALRRIFRGGPIVGHSPAFGSILKQAALVAPLDVTVSITGETGTGKSWLARLIHENGARAACPCVELNCAAIPDSLLESELFGVLPGAHSAAVRRIEGKVASANHGTLILDEIAELSTGAQAKLLQLLQSKTYYPLGSAQPVTADVRVITTSSGDLPRLVTEGKFREDLYFRLSVLPIRMPSLSERAEDIAPLAIAACERAVARHRLPALSLSKGALVAIQSAEWPGNIRQLEHAVEAATVRAAAEEQNSVESRHVFPDAGVGDEENLTFQESTRRFQMNLLRQILERTDWNVVETARRLDVTRSHIYNLIRAFGLERSK